MFGGYLYVFFDKMYSYLLPIFKLGSLFFVYELCDLFNTLDINSLSDTWFNL